MRKRDGLMEGNLPEHFLLLVRQRIYFIRFLSKVTSEVMKG